MSIIAWLSQTWFGEVIMLAINWWKRREAEVQRAANEYAEDLQAHADDGAKSVELKNSYEAQMNQIQRELDEETRKAEAGPSSPSPERPA